MKQSTYSGLLDDSIIGHLLCVYLKLNAPVDDKYYFIINQTDQLITTMPGSLKQLGICDIKRTFGVGLISLVDQYERKISLFSELSLTAQTTQSENIIKFNQERLKILNGLLNKYKVHETPANYSELEKYENNNEINKCLAYVISFNSDQHKKLSSFLKRYTRLYLEKELDGQQQYTLPQHYINALLGYINNSEYIKFYGYKNLQLNKTEEPFFCHMIMVLLLQKKIKIRRMHVTNQSVHVIFDNLSQQEIIKVNKLTKNTQIPTWRDDFIWEGNKFVFGTYGSIDFDSPDRESLFRKLTNAKGHWVKVSELKGDKDDSFVRPTISQIEKRFKPELKKYVSIPSQENDDMLGKPERQGAYRLKFSLKP